MKNQTGTPQGDGPEIGDAAITDGMPLQQIREWITAHRLEGRRVCTGFRIEELGLGELLPALGSRRHSLGSRS